MDASLEPSDSEIAPAAKFGGTGVTIPADKVKRLRDAQASQTPDAKRRAREFFDSQSRNPAKINAAGARIAFGTDSGVTVGWDARPGLTDMDASGMTPSQVIVAATKTSAEVLKRRWQERRLHRARCKSAG